MQIPSTSLNAQINGPQYIVDNVDVLHIVKNVLSTDTDAQAIGKSIGSFPYSGADITLNAQSNGDLFVDFNGKNGGDPTDTATAGEDSAALFINSVTGEVIKTFDVTDRAITNETGDTMNTGAFRHSIKADSNAA